MTDLRLKLRKLDGKSYPAYKSVKGTHVFERFELDILHVQGDPFAQPSRVSIRIDAKELPFKVSEFTHTPSRKLGFEDGLLRTFSKLLYAMPTKSGSGKSGIWRCVRLGQEMIPRSACELDQKGLTLRFFIGLPARGRRIMGHAAAEMLTDELPRLVEDFLSSDHLDVWRNSADFNEIQEDLRTTLEEESWLAFIADGSKLPRRSGIDDRPLSDKDTVKWESPTEMEVEVDLPHLGKVKGSAFRPGVTLICGGGFHGKSTVLHALERSVYNHVPGDGRELCVTRTDAVSIRAEEGRSIQSVDISPFITNLPNGENTSVFSTENGSGSTSQAANISESIEIGARVFLIDEDTSATNFMIRDRRMQDLVEKSHEPITPFLDRVREMYESLNISSILVLGGSGDYFDVADHVITMEAYRPRDTTKEAKQIAKRHPSTRSKESPPFGTFQPRRIPDLNVLRGMEKHRRFKVKAVRNRWLQYGPEEIELSFLNQLVDEGQTRTIGDWIKKLVQKDFADQDLSMLVRSIEEEANTESLSKTTNSSFGDRVMPRRFELAAAFNRLRTLKFRS